MKSPLVPSILAVAGALALIAQGCGSGARAEPAQGADGQGGGGAAASVAGSPTGSPAESTAGSTSEAGKVPVYGYEVVERYPHDPRAYTQGLLWHDGQLYEGTGQRGESTLRKVDLKTGKVEKKRAIDSRYFGEGLAVWGGVFYQLTWKLHTAFLYDAKSLRPLSYQYSYPGEGWGLTTDDKGLVLSDGTDVIRFLNPKGMKEVRRIEVRHQGRRVFDLNELEWIKGEIWANIWKSDRIARIDPKTGEVKAWVDLAGILGDVRLAQPDEEVLNGIAYDEEGDRLFVTGKRWPYLYHIRVVEK